MRGAYRGVGVKSCRIIRIICKVGLEPIAGRVYLAGMVFEVEYNAPKFETTRSLNISSSRVTRVPAARPQNQCPTESRYGSLTPFLADGPLVQYRPGAINIPFKAQPQSASPYGGTDPPNCYPLASRGHLSMDHGNHCQLRWTSHK